MKCLLTFRFQYDENHEYPDGRAFLVTFDVEPTRQLALRIDEKDDDFYDRTSAMLDELDINFAEWWNCGKASSFGWLTNCHDDLEDPCIIMQKVRDYFLAEGFTGGEIRELTEDEWNDLQDNDVTGDLLLAAIEALPAE